MSGIHIVFTSLLYVVSAQIADISDGSTILPPIVQKYYDDTGLAKIKEAYMEMFKRKCFKNGNEEAYDMLQANGVLFISCMSSLIDFDTLLEEIDDKDQSNVKFDATLKKYCKLTPGYKECFHDVIYSIKPCFSVEEQNNLKYLADITDQVVDFVCYKNGDRISYFISDAGDECFKIRQEDIHRCVDKVMQLPALSDLNNETLAVDNFFYLNFKEKQCNQMNSLQDCVVGTLETCNKPTSASIIESLFKTIRKVTPCQNMNGKNEKDAASAVTIAAGTFIMSLMTAMLV